MHETRKIKDRAACALPKAQDIIHYISETLHSAGLSLSLQRRAIWQSRILRLSKTSCTLTIRAARVSPEPQEHLPHLGVRVMLSSCWKFYFKCMQPTVFGTSYPYQLGICGSQGLLISCFQVCEFLF